MTERESDSYMLHLPGGWASTLVSGGLPVNSHRARAARSQGGMTMVNPMNANALPSTKHIP